MAVSACLQALVKFEGCQAILQKGLPEVEAATPSAEMQTKLQEVPSSAALHLTSRPGVELDMIMHLVYSCCICLDMCAWQDQQNRSSLSVQGNVLNVLSTAQAGQLPCRC